ncbi:MAG: hypothetical protein ABMB14_40230 [Myxococcota bacterium]
MHRLTWVVVVATACESEITLLNPGAPAGAVGETTDTDAGSTTPPSTTPAPDTGTEPTWTVTVDALLFGLEVHGDSERCRWVLDAVAVPAAHPCAFCDYTLDWQYDLRFYYAESESDLSNCDPEASWADEVVLGRSIAVDGVLGYQIDSHVWALSQDYDPRGPTLLLGRSVDGRPGEPMLDFHPAVQTEWDEATGAFLGHGTDWLPGSHDYYGTGPVTAP